MSEKVCATAGIDLDALARSEVVIRGRDEKMAVRLAEDPEVLG